MSEAASWPTVPRPIRLRTAWPLALMFVVLGVFALGNWLSISARGREAKVDFVSLAVAAELAEHHSDRLYDFGLQADLQHELSGDPTAASRPFANPPFVAQLAQVLTTPGLRDGYLLLAGLNVAALAGIGVVLCRVASRLGFMNRLLLVSGCLAGAAVNTAMAEGAVTVFVGLGLSVVVLGEVEDRPWLTAAGLTLATLKPHLIVVPLIVLVARHRHAVLVRFAAAATALGVTSLATIGIGPWLAYPAALADAGSADAPAMAHAEHWWNVGAVLHLLMGPGGARLVSLATWLLFALGTAATVSIAVRRPGRMPMAVVAVIGVLLSPHANPHDLIWLPCAFAALWADPSWCRRRTRHRVALGILAGVWPLASWFAVGLAEQGGSLVAVALIGLFVAVSVGTGPARQGFEVDVPNEPAGQLASTSSLEGSP